MIRKFLFVGAAAAAMSVPALAQEVEVSGNVALTTDYMWRGVSLSDHDFAVQGGFDVAAGNFYAGTWASSLADGGASLELDLYGGFAGELEGGVSWDVGIIGYYLPGTSGADDIYEVYGGLGYEFTSGLAVGGYVYYDFDNETTWVEGSVGYAFSDMFGVDATLGNFSADAGDDYSAFTIGATVATPVGLDLDFRFHSNDIDAMGTDFFDETFTITVSKSL